jgi:predicted acylesterase/phospholipase RssA
MKVLRKSKNKYAEAVVKNQVPQKIFESFNEKQEKKLTEVLNYLAQENIEFIRSSSSGRLSKYYVDETSISKYPMKVVRKLFGTDERIIFDINEATDLFTKFSKSHAVNRLHCDFESLTSIQQKRILELIHS